MKKRKRSPGVKWGRPVSTHTGARRERESFKRWQPLLVTLRLRAGLPNLRCKRGARLVKSAIIGAHKAGIRVLHFSILSNHIHLLVEAEDKALLSKGMKSFCSRLGIHLRRWGNPKQIKELTQKALGLFQGRYHVSVLKSPRQVKHAIAYVLLNPAKHFKRAAYIDAYTSGAAFTHWRELLGKRPAVPPDLKLWQDKLTSFLMSAQLWLSHTGWMKAKEREGFVLGDKIGFT